jgi:hypothetical protein
MPMLTIIVPPELEQTITEQAQQKGTTPELLTLDVLHREFLPASPPPANEGTLADFLGDFIGCLDSGEIVPGGARMSENIGAKFAEGMAESRGYPVFSP